LHYPDTEDYDDLFLSADGKTEAMVYLNFNGGCIIDYFAFDPEDLDYIIPANLAPANSKIRSIAPMRHSSSRSATMRNNFMKSNKPMRSLNTFVRN
jgi:hypothetical protein